VQVTIHDVFVEKLVAMARQAKLGDPSKPETPVGPVTAPPRNMRKSCPTSTSPKPTGSPREPSAKAKI
jgi:hypothetical protein